MPNGLTALRSYLALPILLCAVFPLPGRTGFALWCGVGGPVAFLDAADGYVARRFGPLTRLGAAVDPGADVLFFSIAAVGCYRFGIIPGWMAGLMLVRYLGPLLATPLVFANARRPELTHTYFGRLNTAFTGALLFILMWLRLLNGPVDLVALVAGVPLMGSTTLAHFVALGKRTASSPRVTERQWHPGTPAARP